METPYLQFRYKKVVNIDLGNGEQYEIPYKMAPNPNPACETGVPDFTEGLQKIHKVELADERPLLPEKGTMPEELYTELCKEAWQQAAAARAQNARVRKAVAAYVKSGSIELISDPFTYKMERGFGEFDNPKKATSTFTDPHKPTKPEKTPPPSDGKEQKDGES